MGKAVVNYTQEQKLQAVISLYSRSKPAKEIAADYGTTRGNLYNWKVQLLKNGCVKVMTNNKSPNKSDNKQHLESEESELNIEKDSLERQVADLKKEVQRLKIERAVYEKAAEVIKKGQGINLRFLTNREKAITINALRDSYQLKELLEILEMAKSSYCYQVIALNTDKYKDLRIKIKDAFNESSSRYGYRRIHSIMKSAGTVVSEKVVRQIMKEDKLIVPNIKRKKYNSYKGGTSHILENKLKRDFKAVSPNKKWVTDVTEFNVRGEKVYLSPILDLFNNEIVSYNISRRANFIQITDMLDKAFKKLPETPDLILHSDQGWQYRLEKYQVILKEKGITQSMSGKGNCYDNAVVENFFGILKSEMFYDNKFETVDHFVRELEEYIDYYNNERIKIKLKGLSPVQYRIQFQQNF